MVNGLGRNVRIGQNRSPPAEPQAAMSLEQGANGNRKPAGLVAVIAARHSHAIRNHYQPRQYRSSQLRDSRIAVKIRPVIE
jgi:hypothetical protein